MNDTQIIYNFIDTMDMTMPVSSHIANAYNDGRMYKWKQEFVKRLILEIRRKYQAIEKKYGKIEK